MNFGLKRSSGRAAEIFAKQFEEHRDGWVYRRNMRGAPIPVENHEIEAFVSQYRDSYILTNSIIVGTSLVVLLIFAFACPDLAKSPGLYVLTGTIFLAIFAGNRWIWNAPARILKHRQAVGEPISRAQFTRDFLEKTPFRAFISGIAVAASFLLLGLWKRAEGLPHSEYWVVLGTILLALGTVQLARKMLLKRGD